MTSRPIGPIRRRVLVRGQVQGVFFRRSCADAARELGVAGWVRNLVDGTVEVAAEGGEAAVAALVAWCAHGPAGAAVTGLEICDEAPLGEAGFTVR